MLQNQEILLEECRKYFEIVTWAEYGCVREKAI